MSQEADVSSGFLMKSNPAHVRWRVHRGRIAIFWIKTSVKQRIGGFYHDPPGRAGSPAASAFARFVPVRCDRFPEKRLENPLGNGEFL
jgi:hypothetical protein